MRNLAYLILDETGIYVEGCVYAPSLPEGVVAIALPLGLDPRGFLHHHLVAGQLEPRPTSPVPVQIPGGWSIPACPLGTQIMIHDCIGQETLIDETANTEGQNFEFSLPDVGAYEVEVSAPLPHLPIKRKIEVQ